MTEETQKIETKIVVWAAVIFYSLIVGLIAFILGACADAHFSTQTKLKETTINDFVVRRTNYYDIDKVLIQDNKYTLICCNWYNKISIKVLPIFIDRCPVPEIIEDIPNAEHKQPYGFAMIGSKDGIWTKDDRILYLELHLRRGALSGTDKTIK